MPDERSTATNEQADQQQSGKAYPQTAPAPAAVDNRQLLDALTQVFLGLQNRGQSQAAAPAASAAVDAVRVFNDLRMSLQLKSLPGTPNPVTAEAVSATEIRVRWTDDARNADGFTILRCQGQRCSDFAELKARVPAGEPGYLDRDLTSETTYRYRVVAFNSLGESDPSEVAEATTKKT